MPANPRPTFPPFDVEAARAVLQAGRPVRVGVLPSRQFPDGAAGYIRRIGNPAADGMDYIQIELPIAGVKDVIPFAPTDLSPITRTQAAPTPMTAATGVRGRRPSVRAAQSPLPTPTPVSLAVPGSTPQPTPTQGPARTPPAPAPARTPPLAPAPPPARTPPPAKLSAAGVDSAPPPKPAATRAARRAAQTGAAVALPAPVLEHPAEQTPAGAQQPVLITLGTTEPDHLQWQLQVTVGTRVVVTTQPVHPARAWALVADLGDPAAERVVAQALSRHRLLAQDRAERLARELAAAQAELAAYPPLDLDA